MAPPPSADPAVGTAGTYILTITARNGVNPNATQTFYPYVDVVVNITQRNSTTFTAGQTNSFTVTESGGTSPTFSESGALPNGVTFTDNGDGTASLSGTPAAGTAGVYKFSITGMAPWAFPSTTPKASR